MGNGITLGVGLAHQLDKEQYSGLGPVLSRLGLGAPEGIRDISKFSAPDYFEATVTFGASVNVEYKKIDWSEMGVGEKLAFSISSGLSASMGYGINPSSEVSIEPFTTISLGAGWGVGHFKGTDVEVSLSVGHFNDLLKGSIAVEAQAIPGAIQGGGAAIPLGSYPGAPGTKIYLTRSASKLLQKNGAFEFEYTILIIGEEAIKVARKLTDDDIKLSELAEYFAPPECFLSGTSISMFEGSTKPIEDIALDDKVLSYDEEGVLRSGRVTRIFQNTAKQILDVHGLMMTPGHVTFCGDGEFEGQHVAIIDILRSDGALVLEDGSMVRAATGCAVGTEGDRMITAIVGETLPDGKIKVTETKQIRLGTRFILESGHDVSVLDLIAYSNGTVTEDGLIQTAAEGPTMPFYWTLTSSLPKHEDYVLQRSATHLQDIYQANEWEAAPPRVLAPPNCRPRSEFVETPVVNVPLSLRGQEQKSDRKPQAMH